VALEGLTVFWAEILLSVVIFALAALWVSGFFDRD